MQIQTNPGNFLLKYFDNPHSFRAQRIIEKKGLHAKKNLI
jgi:hypothetical protein